MVNMTLTTFWKGHLSNFQMFSTKRCWLYLCFKWWLEIACPQSEQVVIILWTVFSSGSNTKKKQQVLFTKQPLELCHFHGLVHFPSHHCQSNNHEQHFCCLLVASVTNVVYLLLFSQMSSWITNGHQRPPKILLVHSSGRQKGPVCSSRVSTCLGPCPPCRGQYTQLHPNFFSPGINSKTALTLLNLC